MPVESRPKVARRNRQKEALLPLTYEELEKIALAYLNRFDSTAANLERVLVRRLRARGAPEEAGDLVLRLVKRYVDAGLVDDQRYAATMAAGLRRRGASLRAIERKLAARGIERSTIGAALAAEGIDAAGELDAARRVARKKRLGPWRVAGAGVDRGARDLAVLARAGFSFEVARRVLGDPGLEEPEP